MSVNILDSNRHLKSIAGGDIPIATNLNAGKVKPDGTTITITQDGTISAAGADPTPIATTEVAGKVKPDGTTITVTTDGTISSSAQPVPIATTEVAGKVKPDGSSITIAADGTITSVQQEDYWEQKTLSALNWNSNTKSYDLTSIYPSNEYDILELTPVYNVTTDAQLKAWKAAQCGGYNATNVIYARGEVPSIDIILMALVHPK